MIGGVGLCASQGLPRCYTSPTWCLSVDLCCDVIQVSIREDRGVPQNFRPWLNALPAGIRNLWTRRQKWGVTTSVAGFSHSIFARVLDDEVEGMRTVFRLIKGSKSPVATQEIWQPRNIRELPPRYKHFCCIIFARCHLYSAVTQLHHIDQQPWQMSPSLCLLSLGLAALHLPPHQIPFRISMIPHHCHGTRFNLSSKSTTVPLTASATSFRPLVVTVSLKLIFWKLLSKTF